MRFKIYIIKYYELTFGYFICIPESLYYIHIAKRLLCTISSQSIVTNTDALYLGVCCVLSHVWLFATPWTAASHGDSPGKNTGMVDFIHRVEFGEVSGHRVLLKRLPGNRGPTECVTSHEAMSGRSS